MSIYGQSNKSRRGLLFTSRAQTQQVSKLLKTYMTILRNLNEILNDRISSSVNYLLFICCRFEFKISDSLRKIRIDNKHFNNVHVRLQKCVSGYITLYLKSEHKRRIKFQTISRVSVMYLHFKSLNVCKE